jgi:hypothetical protein
MQIEIAAQAPTPEMAVTPPSIRKSAADDLRGIIQREVNRQLRDFQRIGHPLAWIVSPQNVLNRVALTYSTGGLV